MPMVRDAIRRVEPASGRIEVNLEFLDVVDRARDVGGRGATPRLADAPEAPGRGAQDGGAGP